MVLWSIKKRGGEGGLRYFSTYERSLNTCCTRFMWRQRNGVFPQPDEFVGWITTLPTSRTMIPKQSRKITKNKKVFVKAERTCLSRPIPGRAVKIHFSILSLLWFEFFRLFLGWARGLFTRTFVQSSNQCLIESIPPKEVLDSSNTYLQLLQFSILKSPTFANFQHIEAQKPCVQIVWTIFSRLFQE